MTEDTAIAALQRSLNEARDAKRKIQGRLRDLEAEAESLRSQITTFNALIEQTEGALRRALFPTERELEPGLPGRMQTEPVAPSRPVAEPTVSAPRYDPGAFQSAEIEREVATHRLSEQSSNVRFNDFRIPQAATIVLREAGGPLHVSEIYRRMADGGFEFRGQHQLITLAVSLSRSKRFRKVAPGTFELDPRYLTGQVA
jgi:hypothetical protein